MIPRGARLDPRLYQIAVLALLLAYGALALDFDVRPLQCGAILATALGVQLACARVAGMRNDPRSALISALSLCLLLRTNDLWVAAAAATIAIGSKFVVRVRGKHLFNPTNIALVLLIACTDRVWVSPGQWGSVAYFAFLVACLGGLVVTRASRADVTLAFATAYAALVVLIWWSADTLSAFCGFYVCKADTRLFNQASQVVLVRDDDRTVLTMANDFKGDPREFAVVIPVPTVLERGQIHIGDKALIEHLDAYSAPRL